MSAAVLRDLEVTATGLLQVDLRRTLDDDGLSLHANVYDTGSDGFPRGDGVRDHVVFRMDGRLVRLAGTRGHGAIVDLIDRGTRDVMRDLLSAFAFRRLLNKRLDFALFAVDHDDGHGPERVAAGVRELWAQSGAKTWEDCAARRERILAWMREVGRP